MIRNFYHSKDTIKYLERRYGCIKNNAIRDDITLIKDISTQHSLEELHMMKRRIKNSLLYNGDESYISNHLQPTLLGYIVSISTLSISVMTVYSNWLQGLFTKTIDLNKEEIEQKDITELFNLLEPSFLFTVVGLVIVVFFIIILLGGWLMYKKKNQKTSIATHYVIIIDEAIMNIEKDTLKTSE
ncbi:hypothetical protein [Halolactibacillus sp. JCM 19043]|uniref:hypothetical protein n=1 Tax=Halolactibacillus sp. JCM 19043 TaxID=1460638 RepID=UPI0007859AC3|nr:hypothetical protein [Halolactibacillus sp. JCM 19043]